MIAYGQVDGRARSSNATDARTDQWAATVADPEFWVWLQGHAITQAHAAEETSRRPEAAVFGALSAVAGNLLGLRADALAADMRGLRPGNAKNRRR